MKIEDIGQLVVTKGIDELMVRDSRFSQFIHKSLGRYIKEDWSDLPFADKDANDLAVINKNDRLLAAYDIQKNGWDLYDRKIWIMTDADFTYTTIMFPSEY
jgi:hypothetical protein